MRRMLLQSAEASLLLLANGLHPILGVLHWQQTALTGVYSQLHVPASLLQGGLLPVDVPVTLVLGRFSERLPHQNL